MAKLVVLSAGLNGRSHEIVDKTTIGRVEDNSFQIAEPSVSSHHCEILLRGSDVVVKDLNSTNGTFINGEKISERILKPGQTLRLGQIELQLLTEGMPIPPPSAAPAPTPAAAPGQGPVPAMPPGTPPRKPMDQTAGIQRGVSLNELSEGSRPAGFDTTSKAFSKKTNQTNRLFVIGAIVVGVVILVVLLFVFNQAKH
jgi:pSer/pThr/pTyr-binding forkhead associated (FHA) protein